MWTKTKKSNAFTLIELLVVIAILLAVNIGGKWTQAATTRPNWPT